MQEKFFTNRDEQKLLEEITNEILTSDEVYLIYPFISKTILNKLEASFIHCHQNNIPVKIISTTFDNLSMFNNLNELKLLTEKYNNIAIKIENNLEGNSERIHIKASIFKRKNLLHSAIVGSSNLTEKGMITGKEWNLKLVNKAFESNSLVNQMIDEFDNLWKEDFVDFSNQFERDLLIEKIKENQDELKNKILNEINVSSTKKRLYKFQKEIIDKLSYRRFLNNNNNLLVMATGTGKTLVSAFDYKRQLNQANKELKLLFIAHQKEILDQAIKTYRDLLEDYNFGELMYDGNIVSNNVKHLFATPQSLNNRISQFEKDAFDIIIFDEAHHIAANTFDKIFNYFKPNQVLGLTATPEREDNKDIRKYFNNEFAAELRLWDAIDQKLLSGFDYYCIDDVNTNLLGVDLNSDAEIFKNINTESRNNLLYSTIEKYIGVYARPTTLIFCVTVEHAKIISDYLNSKNLKAAFLTSQNTKDRNKILHEFKTGRINYLCVVNIFNEGVDVPEINTIILLRPTNSKTVYLQQLGRGLRKTQLKTKLEVYDLIANIDNKYDLTIGIRNLFNPNSLGFKFEQAKLNLPYNCTITLEKQAEEKIKNHWKKWYGNKNVIQNYVVEYYKKYEDLALEKILHDFEIDLLSFYNNLDDLFVKVAKQVKIYSKNENDTNRNKNILKQFIFLDNFNVVNYFYKRLTKTINVNEIDLDYDNLLMTSFLYEITQMSKFIELYPNYKEIDDLVEYFINTNTLIVEELIMILKYKLNNETLIFTNDKQDLILESATYTVKQVLSIVNRTNFLHYRRELQILTFQAGYLTFDNSTQIILADEDGNDYGKLTKVDYDNNKFYWSLPEKMTIKNKIISDFNNPNIVKYLFIHDKKNYNKDKMFLKLYKFAGIGNFNKMIEKEYLTVEFDLKNYEKS